MIRERFAKSVARGIQDLRIKRATSSPINGLIENAVIEVTFTIVRAVLEQKNVKFPQNLYISCNMPSPCMPTTKVQIRSGPRLSKSLGIIECDDEQNKPYCTFSITWKDILCLFYFSPSKMM